MSRPQFLAISALIAAAAWSAAPHAQTPATPSNSERSVTTPSDRGAASPSRTDRDTASTAQRNDNARNGAGKDGNAKMNRGERKFLTEVAAHNMAEIQTGKIAESKATNPEVKKFGERMVQDHSKANEELKQVAQSKGIQLPSDADRGHKREADRLQKLSGADFDKKYIGAMVKDHEQDVKEFRKMAKNAKDPEVRAFAEKTLPVLEEHLNLARQAADATGAPRGGRSNKSAAVNPSRQSSTSGASGAADNSAGRNTGR
jgi:putative membrane protein